MIPTSFIQNGRVYPKITQFLLTLIFHTENIIHPRQKYNSHESLKSLEKFIFK